VARPLLIVLFVCFFIVSAHVAQADPPKNNLIPALPQYLEATHAPADGPNNDRVYPPEPTPSEQMYVFWILGKVISYPVDTVEAYVTRLREEWRAKPVPAAAVVGPNPFETRRLGQIPPAPPVVSGSRGR